MGKVFSAELQFADALVCAVPLLTDLLVAGGKPGVVHVSRSLQGSSE